MTASDPFEVLGRSESDMAVIAREPWDWSAYRQRRAEIAATWRTDGLRYFSLGYFLKNLFGQRVQKVSIDAGLTCPNVDGTVAYGGCNFCDNRSFSPSRRMPRRDIFQQIEAGIRLLKLRYRVDKFIAYFQPATNTYADIDDLDWMYAQALRHPQVCGMAVGTRPDCVPPEVMQVLERVAKQVMLSVEYGMQTMHDRSLAWMNRGHEHAATIDAVQRSREHSFEVCLHIMLSLPTETRAEMIETAREVARLRVDAVKIHNLYIVKKTPLAMMWEQGDLRLMERDEYVETVVDFIELLPPEMIVERISGDAPSDYFLAPSWSLDKPGILQAIDQEFARRDSWQGKHYQA
jgi:radical SAM protein (TIGR01212 family)